MRALRNKTRRGVAQPGSVLAWGASGRPFKSARPDQFHNTECRGTDDSFCRSVRRPRPERKLPQCSFFYAWHTTAHSRDQ